VAFFAYRRPLHTLRALQALAANRGAEKTVLYVFCDGAEPDASRETLDAIAAVREVVRKEPWCGTVKIECKETHHGLAASLIAGITTVIAEHGRVIVLEDDLVTNPDFLSFMNRALDHYEPNPHVYGVSGFALVDGAALPEVFLLPIGSSWGWATWRSAWDCFEVDARQLVDTIEQRSLETDFNFGGYPYFEMLKQQASGEIDSWAIRYYASFFLRGGHFAFPRSTLVQNTGFDGSGTHGDEGSPFDAPARSVNTSPEAAFPDLPNPETIRTAGALMRCRLAPRTPRSWSPLISLLRTVRSLVAWAKRPRKVHRNG
jgi:hypothetical protein